MTEGSPRGALWALCASVSATLALAVVLAPRETRARRPADDQLVLTDVPARSTVDGRALEALRATQLAAPDDEQAAVHLVHAHIERSRRDGDPRPLGLAEAVLAPFMRDAASTEVLVLYATIQQSRHQFEAALHTLARARAQMPDDRQTLLTQATVLTVLGRFDEAQERCSSLHRASPVLGMLCAAPIALMTGRADQALDSLQQLHAQTNEPVERAWMASLACENRYWQGDDERAQTWCEHALQLDPADRYTRALYSDVLLDAQAAERVLPLVSGRELDDALLLRSVLAQLPEAKHSNALARLREGFERDRARGEAPHAREEARLLLALGEDQRALASAADNFRVQREPWDVRLLLEAALRTGDKHAAAPALRFIRESGFAAPRIRTLMAQIEGLP